MMKSLNLKYLQQFIVLSLLALLSTQVLAGKRTTTYMHTDALGSVVAASDKDGNLLWRKQYMPFGSEINRDPTLKELSYTGKKFDAELGLSYSGARYYDPSLGRFGGIDPATALESVEPNPMMFNRYAYANNNPYRYNDPDGNCSVEVSSSQTVCSASDAIAAWLEPKIEAWMKSGGIKVLPPDARDPNGVYKQKASQNSVVREIVAVTIIGLESRNPRRKTESLSSSIGGANNNSKAKRRASREAQRQHGTPTSRSGKNHQDRKPGSSRHQTKEGADGTTDGIVDGINDTVDGHGPHIEVGKVKVDEPFNKYNQPRLKNDKVKVEY